MRISGLLSKLNDKLYSYFSTFKGSPSTGYHWIKAFLCFVLNNLEKWVF